MSQNAPTDDPLISELQDEDLLELIEDFVSTLPDRMTALEHALSEQNIGALCSLAHQLKGAAGGYGFPAITDVAKQLETEARSNEGVEELESKIRELANLCRRARASATA